MKHHSTTRLVRLTQIQHFLHQNPHGLTTKELANLCGTAVRTIQRDLLILQSDLHIPLIDKKYDRYGILQDYLLPPVSYSVYEALIIFLAARLIIRQTDEYNPHLRSAISKLTSSLPEPLATQLSQSLQKIALKPSSPEELDIFEKVSLAWVTRKRLRITYHSFHRERVEEWYVNPYFVEITGVGFSIYLIGYAECGERMGIYTFKLNRIQKAEIIDENYEMPHEIRMDELLSSSWGVIWGEESQVKLRFSPAVARRVKESIWHPSQAINDLPDGGCLMTLKVSSTLEITPWLRGWGPDVEVLEPPELRNKFKGWARDMGEIYK